MTIEQVRLKILDWIYSRLGGREWETTLGSIMADLGCGDGELFDTLHLMQKDGQLQIRQFIRDGSLRVLHASDNLREFLYSRGFRLTMLPGGRAWYETTVKHEVASEFRDLGSFSANRGVRSAVD